MSWEAGLKKIKDTMANMGYNILGYDHNEIQKQTLEPWFFPKKKGTGLPPVVGEFLNEVKQKYPLAACRHFKVPGQINVDVFCGIKADGMSIPDIQQALKDFEATFYKVEVNRFPKKTVQWAAKKAAYVSLELCLIYENGIEGVENVQSCWKKQKLKKPTPRDMVSTRPYIIDLANQRVYKHKGIPLKTACPSPDKFAAALFSL